MVDITPQFPEMPKHLYAIHIMKTGRGAPYPGKIFVVVKKGFTTGPSMYTGVGYWTDTHPSEEGGGSYGPEEVQEVSIPHLHIAYVENLNYRFKG